MRCLQRFLFCLGWMVWAISLQAQEPLLRKNDRVAFFGDSLTEGGEHITLLQQYIYATQPELGVRFFRYGWQGEDATAALARLQRDLFPEKPTLVIIHYGMNDGGYAAVNDAMIVRYTTALSGIISAVKKIGARAVLVGPTCVDETVRPDLAKEHYNQALHILSEAALNLAHKEQVPFVNLYDPLLAYQMRVKQSSPGNMLLPDGVHPGGEASLVMAREMMTQLGLPAPQAWGVIDLSNQREGEGLRLAHSQNGFQLESTRQVPPAVWWPEEEKAALERSGALEVFAGRKLTVKGIPTGKYTVEVEGQAVGIFDSQDLSNGVFVADTRSVTAKKINQYLHSKDASFHLLWRDIRVFYLGLPGAVKSISGLLEMDEGYHQLIQTFVSAPRRPALALLPTRIKP